MHVADQNSLPFFYFKKIIVRLAMSHIVTENQTGSFYILHQTKRTKCSQFYYLILIIGKNFYPFGMTVVLHQQQLRNVIIVNKNQRKPRPLPFAVFAVLRIFRQKLQIGLDYYT